MSRIDRSFERWCRRGDARALERLFDAAAPRLLRLGVHLVGDAAEAEDLVQAVFLALIEGRERIDATRPAWPWLASVLARRAVDARRRAGRAAERDELRGQPALELAAEDASAPSERRELAAELARAIDKIDEPYRQALVLSLRHGLSAAEIAHALGRSAATVRVQLCRGRERLRLLLPASLAGGALLLFGAAPRGLASVKQAVMGAAAAKSIAAGGAPLVPLATGVAVVSQKGFVIAAACAALALFVALGTREPPAGDDAVAAEPSASDALEEPAIVDGIRSTATAVETQSERVSEAASSAAALRGRVYDAQTGAPIEGAQLALYPPQEISPLDALRASPELYRSDPDGRVRSRSGGDWPHLEEVSDLARAGRATARVYGRPAREDEPIARTTSGAHGRFELPATTGVLRCEREGYVSRIRAARSLEREWDFELHRERVLEGVVVTNRMEPPGVPLRLAFGALRIEAIVADDPDGAPAIHVAESLGAWTTECAPDGTFSVAVGADDVVPSILTPGWALGWIAWVPVEQPLRLVAKPVPVLRVFDAASGVPIERVRLQGRESANGYVIWSGVFHAPGGLLELPGGDTIVTGWGRDAASFVVWADGYAAARISIAALEDARTLDVPLERGTSPSLEGVLTREGRPARGARIALLGHSPLQWNRDEDHLIEACVADGAGGFRVEAPEGRYVLRAEHDGLRYLELVELPCEEPLVIDLARGGRIDVLVVDEGGAPRAGHSVAVNGADGRSDARETDAEGRAAFVDLSPQDYTVFTTLVTGLQSFGADLLEEVALARDERREVRFVLPRHEGTRRLRVHAAGELSYRGWSARVDSGEWQPMEEDGTLAQDVASMHYTFEVEAPDGRRWSLRAPRDARDGEVVELCAGAARIVGSWLGADGEPLADWRVYAVRRAGGSTDGATPSVATGADGTFEIGGLDASLHALLFRSEASSSYDFSMEGIVFAPADPAGRTPRLVLHRPRGGEPLALSGRVLSQLDRTPCAEHVVSIEAVFAVEGGSFHVRSDEGGVGRTDPHGEFAMRVPDAPLFDVQVWREWKPGGLVLQQQVERPSDGPLELLVP